MAAHNRKPGGGARSRNDFHGFKSLKLFWGNVVYVGPLVCMLVKARGQCQVYVLVTLYLILSYYIYLFVCSGRECLYVLATVGLWRSEENLQELILSTECWALN